MVSSARLPDELAGLFWDVEPDAVDLVRHRDYVLERVMSRGGWAAMRWLRQFYAPEVIRDFLIRKGSQRLAPRELAYWSLIAELSIPIPPGGGEAGLGRAMIQGVTPAQQAALQTLAAIVAPATYLAGGVAVALRFAHRLSRDLDLFTTSDELLKTQDALADPKLGVRVLDRGPGTLHLEVAGVPTSVLRYRYPLLCETEVLEGIGIPVASLDDLACMKLSAIAGRGATRDFWDLHTILTSGKRDLLGALDAYRTKYASEDIGHVVRSLVYFADADAEPKPVGLTPPTWDRVKTDFKTWVTKL